MWITSPSLSLPPSLPPSPPRAPALSCSLFSCSLSRSLARSLARAQFHIYISEQVATQCELARVVNLSWAALPLAAGVAPLCAAAAVWRGYDGVDSEEYLSVVMIFGSAAMLELLMEPAYNLVVVCDKLHIRALVDGLAITAKAVTIWAAVVHFKLGALAFAWGQAAYALAQLFGLYGYAAKRVLASGGRLSSCSEDFPLVAFSQLLPAPLPQHEASVAATQPNSLVDRWLGASAAAEATALWRQSLLKHLLTEADKLLLLAAGSTAAGNADAVYGDCLGHPIGRMRLHGFACVCSDWSGFVLRRGVQPRLPCGPTGL